MTDLTPKCPYHHEKGGVCIKCGWVEPKPIPSEPSCEHYSAHFKTSYRWKKDGMFAWGDVCPFCPATKGERESCEHDKGKYWREEIGSDYFEKKYYPTCPFCKPVEPSVESIAHKLLLCKKCDGRGFFLVGNGDEPGQEECGACYQGHLMYPERFDDVKTLIAEALRNERNRKHG